MFGWMRMSTGNHVRGMAFAGCLSALLDLPSMIRKKDGQETEKVLKESRSRLSIPYVKGNDA